MARSIKRAHTRRVSEARRRERSLLRRSGIAAGAAAGAFALAAPAAQAGNFEVNSLADGPSDMDCLPPTDCTLRDAFQQANAVADDDVITFTSTLTGTINLSSGVLVRTGNFDLYIDGPGAGQLTVSGDATNDGSPDSRIFKNGDDGSNDAGSLSIEGLTLTRGTSTGALDTLRGGAVTDLFYSSGEPNRLTNVTITDSVAGTGGIYNGDGGAVFSAEDLILVNTTISGNQTVNGRGGGVSAGSDLTVTDSTISDNHALGSSSAGGGIAVYDALVVSGSTISGNSATGDGGGLGVTPKYLSITDSTISGNSTAASGGGIGFKYGSGIWEISDTTISGNSAAVMGAGAYFEDLGSNVRLKMLRTTVSGNTGGANSTGGGIGFADYSNAAMKVVDSTVSGNSAKFGGGVGFGDSTSSSVLDDEGSIEINNSTVADNSATSSGGGMYLNSYMDSGNTVSALIPLNSTIVADNTPQDLDRADGSTGGGFDTAFSLIERKGDAPLVESPPGSNVLGKDPKLGPLANNGGPTKTQLPAVSSKAIDRGDSNRLAIDQRGLDRIVNFGVLDAATGNATDIGAVELQFSEVPNERCAGKLATIIGDSRVIKGTNGKDIISGTGGKNVIKGRGGNDVICGRGGKDRLLGGKGRDRLLGGKGRDILKGGPGRDKLKGGPGRDIQIQ